MKGDITYKIPKASEVEQIIELNEYLNDLSREKFDSTLSKTWKRSEECKKYFSSFFEEDAFIICAYSESQMIGYLSASVYEADEFREKMLIAELENIMVLPEHQSKGIGKRLYEEFIAWAKRKNADRVKVGVFCKNKNAISFYKKLGFEEYDMNMEKKL